MEEYILGGAATPLIIKAEDDDGVIHEYHFKLRTYNKRRLDASSAYEKKFNTLQTKSQKAGMSSPAETQEMIDLLAKLCDERVVSTNGPVTITSLWDDGLIGLEHVAQTYHKAQEAVGNPPA